MQLSYMQCNEARPLAAGCMPGTQCSKQDACFQVSPRLALRMPALLLSFGWMPAWRSASRSHLRRYRRASRLLRPMSSASRSPICGSSGRCSEPCTKVLSAQQSWHGSGMLLLTPKSGSHQPSGCKQVLI